MAMSQAIYHFPVEHLGHISFFVVVVTNNAVVNILKLSLVPMGKFLHEHLCVRALLGHRKGASH